MSAYFLALIDIHDHKRYEKYLEGFDMVFSKYKGRVVAVEDNPVILEGKWPSKRTVLIRFPNETELKKWYESDEYQKIALHRREASISSVAVISGRD